MQTTDLTGIPVQYQVYVLYGLALFGVVGKILGALTNGGGLKNILLNAWQGKAVPKPIAADYKTELSPPSATKTNNPDTP